MGNPWRSSKFARFFKVWALLLRSKFHSCKRKWDWVLKRTFQHDTSWYCSPEQLSGLTFYRGTCSFFLIMIYLNPRDWCKTLTFSKVCLTKAPIRFGSCFFGATSIPAHAFGTEFWKEISNTTCPAFCFQSKFLARLFFGAPLHFPLIWYYWISGIDGKPWLSSKFAWPRLYSFGLAPSRQVPSEQVPFLQMGVGLISEKNFPKQHPLVLVTKAIFCLDLSPGNLIIFP